MRKLRAGIAIAIGVAATALLLAVLALAPPGAAAAEGPEFPLKVQLMGGGVGGVHSSGFTIDCPSECSANFAAGSEIVLIAQPETGSVFAGWGGACSGTESCIVTMSSAVSVTATFETEKPPVLPNLAVKLTGGGTGRVHDTNFAISCPSECSQDYEEGAQVVLVAEPNEGSTFGGWSGAGCSGKESCIVTMSAAQTVTARFVHPGRGVLHLPVPKSRPRQIRVRIKMGWRWNSKGSTLTRISLRGLPPGAGLSARSHGKGSPFSAVKGSTAGRKGFEDELLGRVFHPGDKLTIAISAPGRRSERLQVKIRREKIPRARLL